MSRTLNLVDSLLTAARRYQSLGREHDATEALERLAGFRELPEGVAEEVQARLAELRLRHRKFRKARRHLTAALGHRPDNARYHYLMGTAVEGDARADPERALEHYRRSLKSDPDQPQCLGKCGLLAVRQGQTEEGLRCLRRAVELAPTDPAPLEQMVRGLRLADQPDEARRALRVALFRNPRDARFRRLWDGARFQEVRRAQESERRRAGRACPDDGPVLLPFRPTASGPRPKVVRQDGPSPIQPPHTGRKGRLSDQRHAQ